MKKLFKLMALGVLTLAFAAVSTNAIFAQDQTEKRELYAKFTECYKNTTDRASMQCALDSAKEYISKYNTDVDKPQTDYFQQTAIPFIEKRIADIDNEAKVKIEQARVNKLLSEFDTAAKNKDFAVINSSGKAIITDGSSLIPANVPLDAAIIIALANYDKAIAKDQSAYGDAIQYAQKAISMLESGDKTDYYGAYSYNLKATDDPKSNTLGFLNYYIGWVKYYGQDKKKEALPYFYKAAQYKSKIQQSPDPYAGVGDYYYDEVARIEKERQAALAANNNEDNEQSLALLGMENGNAERALDAYARAYKYAQADPKTAANYKTGLNARLKNLYKFRFNKEDGLDAYLASVTTKPQADPSTEVKPVMDEKKDDATAPSMDKPMTTTDKSMMTTTKPAADKPTTTTKPAATDKPMMTKPPTTPKKSGAASNNSTAKTKTQKPSPR